MKRIKIANIITALRICGAVALIFLKMGSAAFFAVYTLSGVTDIFDGWIARRTGTASQFGARLDSAADIVFYLVMLIKTVPVLWGELPHSVWVTVCMVLLLRICIYTVGGIKYHCFTSRHTYLNKLTGALVFLVPYFAATRFMAAYCIPLCTAAAAAAAEELIMCAVEKKYNPERKTLFCRGEEYE